MPAGLHKPVCLLFWGMISALSSAGQQVSVKGGFMQDSIGIGEEVHFWLTAEYPGHIDLILPDSNYLFSPFELSDRFFVPTRYRNGMAMDSVVYTLQSFEIDPIQYLSLTSVIYTEKDSIPIESNTDSIYFRAMVAAVSDTTSLRTNLNFQDVSLRFNFPLLWIMVASLMALLGALWLIFGKTIRRNLKIRRLRKEFNRFSDAISAYINDLQSHPEPKIAEYALNTWKRYLENLEHIPYTRYTTKEILSTGNNNELKNTLRTIDKTVYGKAHQRELFKSFQEIEDFTRHRYTMMLDELKNGK